MQQQHHSCPIEPIPTTAAAASVLPSGGGGGGNASAAAALRARLAGGARPPPAAAVAAAPPPAAPPTHGGRAVEALPLVTADGRGAPGAFGHTPRAPAAHRPTPSAPPGGQSDSIAAMAAAERHGPRGGEAASAFARGVAKAGASFGRSGELDVEVEYEDGGGVGGGGVAAGGGLAPRRKARGGTAGAAARDAADAAKAKAGAVRDWQRGVAAAAACPLCVEGGKGDKALRISLGNSSYLALPSSGRLVPGHALIVPMQHGVSGRSCDEDVADEMRNFKKCLLKMHGAAGHSVVFIETHLGGGGAGSIGAHGYIEAVPVPPEAAATAPMFFRKAIDEAESEWSTHAAKKCIPTSGASGLRTAIPPNFPYFHVEFGLREGFVHVIDDVAKWNKHFGRDVLIGLLDLPEEWTRAKPRRVGPQEAVQQAASFAAAFEPHDWTRAL